MKKLLSLAMSSLLFVGVTQQGLAANVATVDTGLDPGVLGGSIAGPGFDFFNNDDVATDDQPGQHGTSGGLSAVRAAPGIRLIPVKAYGSSFQTTSAILDQAFRFVAGSGALSASHSIGSITDTPTGALQAVTNAGIILVIQAGNAAAGGPTGDAAKVASLGGKGIVAGGTLNGSIWSASNRAGNLQDFFLVADVRAPINGWVGTSMATPKIAAIAAALREAYPFLSPQQVVQVMFDSARDLGRPGTDATYGQGEADFGAAMSAVGEGSIPTGGGGDSGSGGGGGGGSGAGLAIGALAIGGAVAYSILNKKEDLKKTIFVDKFGRAFNIDLASRSTTTSNTPLFGLFNAQQQPLSVVPISRSSTPSEFSQTLAFIDDPYASDRYELDPVFGLAVDETRRIGFRHDLNSTTTQYAMGLNTDLSGEFGALSLAGDSRPAAHTSRFLHDQVFTTPAMGFSAEGSSFRFGWNEDDHSHRLGLSVIDDQEEYGIQSNSILYEGRVDRDRVKVGFQVGALVEDGNLLGGSSDGAFSADRSSTYYLGFNGSLDVTQNVSLIGGYFQGMTDVDASSISVLDEFSDLRTEGYGVGVLVDNALSPRGSFGLAYSSPMQTTSGSARLTLPTSQDRFTGAIGFESSTVSFADADREKIVEAYYGYELSSKSDVFAHFSYTRNPVSDTSLDSDGTFYLGWRQQF